MTPPLAIITLEGDLVRVQRTGCDDVLTAAGSALDVARIARDIVGPCELVGRDVRGLRMHAIRPAVVPRRESIESAASARVEAM